MPQMGQIIPAYLHPHVETYINDNTAFTEQTSSSDSPITGIFVFTSGKGQDGVLIKHSSTTSYVDEFGKPDFKKYGQPGYMPYNFLSTGQAQAWCMRVMPEDASYSNVIVLAKVKVETGTGATPVKRMLVRFETVTLPNVLDKNELLPLAEILTNEDPDVDGFLTFPLLIVNSKGRGKYGDAFRFRLATDLQADKENDFKNYRFETFELENSLVRKEVFTGTLDPDSAIGNTSQHIDDKLNDSATGSTKLGVTTVVESFERIFEIYQTEIDPTTTLTFNTFDFFYGRTKENTVITGYDLDSTNAEFEALDAVAGITLASGVDGSFDNTTANAAARDEAISVAYQKAFRGELDKKIRSKRQVPAQFIFDAAYPAEAKIELINLITKRYDAYGWIDAGILNSVTDALAWGESMKGYGDRVFSKEFQHYKTRDPFTGKAIPVTMTYFYAANLPLHFTNVGNQIPFTGQAYTTLTGHVKNSLAPMVDADDAEDKENLYLLRLNYFQSISENIFVRGTQSTSQNIWSDLSEENNMHVLLELKRMIETLVSGLSYNFAEAEDLIRFKEDAQRLLNPYVGVKIQTGVVDFKMSDWEKERSILHCYLDVQFRTMAKRGTIEIDINKRVATA